MKSPLILILSCAAVFAATWLATPAPRGAGEPLPQAPAAPPPPPVPMEKSTAALSPAARLLDQLRIIEGASPAQCRELFTQALEANDAALQEAAARQWAITAPADFWKWILLLTPREVEVHQAALLRAQMLLLRSWGQADPEAASAAVMGAPPLAHLTTAAGEVFNTLVAFDPERAFSLASRFTRMHTEWGIPESAWKSDPARFVRAADRLPQGEVRKWVKEKALYDAVLHWQEREPAAALAWVRRQTVAEQSMFLPKMVEALAPGNFNAAKTLVESLPPSTQAEAAAVELMKVWAASDPQSALTWADARFQGRRSMGLNAVVDGAIKSGPDAMAAIAAALPHGNTRDTVIARVAWQWGQKDSRAAAAWVASLPSDSARRAAFAAVGANWVGRYPVTAAKWIAANPSSDVPDFIVNRAGRQYALRNDAESLAWAVRLPGQQRAAAVRGVVGQLVWLRPQPDFSKLLGALPAAGQNLAVNSMVDNWAYSCEGPQPAWVGTLTPAQRSAARARIGSYTFLDKDERSHLLKALE